MLTAPVSLVLCLLGANDFPIDAVLEVIRAQSVHRHEIKWAEVEPEIRAQAAKARTDAEAAAAIVRLFERLNDVHSVLMIDGRSFSHYEGFDENTRKKLLAMIERDRAQAGKPIGRMLEGQCAYILVPTMPTDSPQQVEKLAAELRREIAKLAVRKPASWIVDLRLNGGGNLYPMLVGLQPLLGEGVAGGTIDVDGRKVHDWLLKPDGLYWSDQSGERRFASLDLPVKLERAAPPIAVLVGPATRSSGQATALAFRGRKNCRLFGEPTARGYTTVTNPVKINPRVMLSLAVGYMADSAGIPCKSQVVPDHQVDGGDNFDNLAADRKIAAAREWLNRKH